MLKTKRCKSGGTNGIPPLGGRESISVAARVRTPFDVLYASASFTVQPGIEETKRGLVFRKEEVINQRDYARHCLGIGGQLGALEWTMQSGRSRR